MTAPASIAILGAGAWGTALAVALASMPCEQHGARRILLWARNADFARELCDARENARYLREVRLPEGLDVTSDFERVAGASLHVLATPMSGLREASGRLKPFAPRGVVWLCKGIEFDSLKWPHDVLAETLPGVPCGALSGPSFADEVARGLPCALVMAARDEAFAQLAAASFHGGPLRVYSSTDVAGVEVAGTVKNVLAVATGICDGLQLGLNARAALVTRGLAEMVRLGARLGAQSETFMGLAGIGDLLLTCTGDLSRNRRVGLAIGRGQTLEQTLASLGHVAEGVRAAQAVRTLAVQHGVDMPITDMVCRVLFESLPPFEAMHALLARERGKEQRW
jgi:glycerol-3-phosphate dehydrogenase (NAD(P)+)